ncbi:predicted transcriptional regulator, MarR [Alteracholeplasma palmae J233]|uniref:Predicted transcriptional regulator, MarR n=1 Tax=Alteracholeplasma palmae (strain ATCC 49389 / J233) TaxID=1318466 RepID=U4KLD8_ALTPJ|nr:MarR family transcriptional regulator [Alteracholeplasma palmae]CCV64632.1 predicted transcriptional regulator, MarR [Alteracholeplasma palmae J233]
MSFYLSEEELEKLLYKFHQTIYCFEKFETDKYGYTWQELYLIKLVVDYPQYKMRELAEKLHVPIFQLTRLVSKLESKKILVKTHKQNDNKSIYLKTTQAGIDLLISTRTRHYKLLKETLKDIDDHSLKTISRFINSLDVVLMLDELEKGVNHEES